MNTTDLISQITALAAEHDALAAAAESWQTLIMALPVELKTATPNELANLISSLNELTTVYARLVTAKKELETAARTTPKRAARGATDDKRRIVGETLDRSVADVIKLTGLGESTIYAIRKEYRVAAATAAA